MGVLTMGMASMQRKALTRMVWSRAVKMEGAPSTEPSVFLGAIFVKFLSFLTEDRVSLCFGSSMRHSSRGGMRKREEDKMRSDAVC